MPDDSYSHALAPLGAAADNPYVGRAAAQLDGEAGVLERAAAAVAALRDAVAALSAGAALDETRDALVDLIGGGLDDLVADTTGWRAGQIARALECADADRRPPLRRPRRL